MYRASSFILLSFACIFGSARRSDFLTDNYDEGEEMYADEINSVEYPQGKLEREAERRWPNLVKRDPAFTPYISVGALSNMQQFFENLKGNLDSLENLPSEERAALLGKQEHTAESDARAFRPPATAAYLHAIRNQRPSHKIRNFVANAEPVTLRGSNYYDPSYLWSGLGRRR